MKKRMLLAAIVILAGCSFSTPYQPKGFRGGYEERQLADGSWLITIRTNAFTDPATAYEYFHRRAEELCDGAYDVLDQDSQMENEGAPLEKPNVFGRVRCLPNQPQTL